MSETPAPFQKIDRGDALARDDIQQLLALSDPGDVQALFDKAYAIKLANVGAKVYFRGIIEFSNVCEKDCFYCGIRSSDRSVERYRMTEEEIVAAAAWAYERHYGSVVLQSGERVGETFTAFVEKVVREIKRASNDALGITLCLGEQSEATYRRWFDAGAHRYLLRIETSNPELYRRYHPADHSYDARLACLKILRKVGYQVGTGVMIGLPGQTLGHLADDILFFKKMDVDMIGMGPYLVAENTPMAKEAPDTAADKELRFLLGLKMIAATRIVLKDVNIAATTALQALDPRGREKGLLAGANVIMPNMTDVRYRKAYRLYAGKPCLV